MAPGPAVQAATPGSVARRSGWPGPGSSTGGILRGWMTLQRGPSPGRPPLRSLRVRVVIPCGGPASSSPTGVTRHRLWAPARPVRRPFVLGTFPAGRSPTSSVRLYVGTIILAICSAPKEVEDAKARGKNAQVCYDYALHTFENIINIASTDAGRCQESAKSSIRKKLHFINHLITTGCELIEELDNIFPNCYKTNSRLSDRKLYSCVKNQYGISKASVKKLKTNARSVRSTAKSEFNIVVQEATDCLNNVYTTARSKVPVARSVATRCLEHV